VLFRIVVRGSTPVGLGVTAFTFHRAQKVLFRSCGCFCASVKNRVRASVLSGVDCASTNLIIQEVMQLSDVQKDKMAWYRVRTQPKHENIAAGSAWNSLGLEVFNPDLRLERATCRGLVGVIEPLFRAGTEVIVSKGPFLGSRGLGVSALPGRQRLEMILDFLGRTSLTEVERTSLMVEDRRMADLIPALSTELEYGAVVAA
jgi:hypothetical protein